MIEKTTTRVDKTIATLQQKLNAQMARRRAILERNSKKERAKRIAAFCDQLQSKLDALPDCDHTMGRVNTLIDIEFKKQGVLNENT